MTRAELFHNIASDLGVDPELVGAVAVELKLKKRSDIEDAVRLRLSGADATVGVDDAASAGSDGSDADDGQQAEAPAPKVRKPGLTLSQRRALLRLLDAAGTGFTPATPFKALPYEHAVEVGYATRNDDGELATYHLTDAGLERAQSINPAYRDWSAGETVAGDVSRPEAGTHRANRAAERAADAAKAAEQVTPQDDAEPSSSDLEAWSQSHDGDLDPALQTA